eukprot:scaffold30357_cov116-Isochrysis_galbana.AAC.2
MARTASRDALCASNGWMDRAMAVKLRAMRARWIGRVPPASPWSSRPRRTASCWAQAACNASRSTCPDGSGSDSMA